MRLTKSERMLIRAVLGNLQTYRELLKWEVSARDSVLAKIDTSEKPKEKRTGISPRDAVEAFKEVLGSRLLAPLSSANGVWAQFGARLNALGVTRTDCGAMAKSAAVQWPRGYIKALSIVNNAEMLLAASQQELPIQTSAIREMDEL